MGAIKGKPVLSRRKRVTLTCEKCCAVYETHAFRAATSKYCSDACRLTRANKTCLQCGVVFGTTDSHGKTFCSKKCSGLYRSGERSAQWKDGKSLDRNRARQSGPLAAWKRAVKERDGFACRQCGGTDHLHAHHKNAFADRPDLATDVDNGITLCDVCHSVQHGRWVGVKNRAHLFQIHANDNRHGLIAGRI